MEMSGVGVLQLLLYCLAVLLVIALHLFLLLIGYLVYIHSKYDHLPGPKRTSFFFGNMGEMQSRTRQAEETMLLVVEDVVDGKPKYKPLGFELLHDWAEEFGDTYVMFMFFKVFVCTRCPEAFKTIMVHGDPRKFPKENFGLGYIFRERYLGESLATAMNHDDWALRRKAIDPVFRRRQLQKAVDVFNVSADNFMASLDKMADTDESFLLGDLINRVTLDVIMRSMFSMDNGSTNLNSEFHDQAFELVKQAFTAMHMSNASLCPRFDPRLRKCRRETRRVLKSFRKKGAEMIRDRQRLMEKDGEVVPEDFLTALIKAYNDSSVGYTFEIMVDEFLTVITAGMETSADALSLMFMELARQPHILDKMIQEVDEVLGNRDHVTNDDITRLSYIHQVIKETLRFYPPVGALLRRSKDQIELNGLRIPADTSFFLLIESANKNKMMVDRPLEFLPERFHPDAEKKVPVYSFATFALGPRNCIGQVFVQMEMKVMVAKFLQRYQFEIDQSETFQLGHRATIYPISKLKGKVFSREASLDQLTKRDNQSDSLRN